MALFYVLNRKKKTMNILPFEIIHLWWTFHCLFLDCAWWRPKIWSERCQCALIYPAGRKLEEKSKFLLYLFLCVRKLHWNQHCYKVFNSKIEIVKKLCFWQWVERGENARNPKSIIFASQYCHFLVDLGDTAIWNFALTLCNIAQFSGTYDYTINVQPTEQLHQKNSQME